MLKLYLYVSVVSFIINTISFYIINGVVVWGMIKKGEELRPDFPWLNMYIITLAVLSFVPITNIFTTIFMAGSAITTIIDKE